MTRDDVIDALSFVVVKWPNAKLPSREEAIAGWLDELAELDSSEVSAALRRMSNREFAPNAGQVAQEAHLARQGTPLSFDELQALLSRHVRLLPYGQRNTPADTALAVAALQDAGAHEALLRFVQQHGLYAVRMMPDPAEHALDPNQLADRRDMSRSYRDTTLPGWQRDPRHGQALERAAERAGLDAGELLELAAGARRERLAAAATRPALPSGEPLPAAGEPTIDPAAALAAWRAERARARAAEREQRAAERAAANGPRRQALDELAGKAGSRR